MGKSEGTMWYYALAVLVLAVGAWFVFDNGGFSGLFNAPPLCFDDATDPLCVCPESYVRLPQTVDGVTYNQCSPFLDYIDVDDPETQWGSVALAYVQDRLRAECPTCNTWACDGNGMVLNSIWAYDTQLEEQVGLVTCTELDPDGQGSFAWFEALVVLEGSNAGEWFDAGPIDGGWSCWNRGNTYSQQTYTCAE